MVLLRIREDGCVVISMIQAIFRKIMRPFYQAFKRMFRPLLQRVRQPLSRLFYPPEFDVLFQRLDFVTHNLQGYIEQNEQTLLAMFRSLSAPCPQFKTTTVGAVALGQDRIVFRHPISGIMLVDPRNQIDSARMVMNVYQIHVQIALSRIVKPGALFIEVGAGPGYHTLTLAHGAGGSGQGSVYEPDPHLAVQLRENLALNELEERITCCTAELSAGFCEQIQKRYQPRTPDIVILHRDLIPAADVQVVSSWLSDHQAIVLAPNTVARKLSEALANTPINYWRIAEDGSLTRLERDQLAQGPSMNNGFYLLSRTMI